MRGTIVLVCVLAFVQSQTVPQETQVKSVGISLRAQPAQKLKVTIENLRNSPLMEVSIDLAAPGAGRQRSYSNFGGYLGRVDMTVPPNGGPVAPHERRVIDVDVPGTDGGRTAALSLVTFADNYYEGTPDALNAWREARQNEADELTYWIRAIDTMPRDSLDVATAHLEARAVERAGQNPTAETRWRVRLWTLSKDTHTTLANLLDTVDRTRAEADRQLTVLRPSLAGTLRARPVASVSLSPSPAPSTAYVVAIENKGPAPIEAFAYESVDSAGRPQSGTGMDMCEMPPGLEGNRGRIAPGEVREYPFGHEVTDGNVPLVRLKYVLFEDLSFEGAAADRAAVFRDRERRAEDVAYALTALRRAVAEPAQALAIMTTARAERGRQLQEQGRQGGSGLGQLDEFIRSIKASPANFAATADARQAYLEALRQRLLRHSSR
jgi:hypothetical protein